MIDEQGYEWLRPQEVAQRLGLTRRTIYQLMYRKMIPPSCVMKLPGYAHAKAINWTAIKGVQRKIKGRKVYGYDWIALQSEHPKPTEDGQA